MILTGWKMCGFKAQNYVKKKIKNNWTFMPPKIA